VSKELASRLRYWSQFESENNPELSSDLLEAAEELEWLADE